MIDIDEIAATLELLPSVVRTLLAPYDDAVLSAPPEPGEWCVRDVVGHLITCDTGAFRGRIEADGSHIEVEAPVEAPSSDTAEASESPGEQVRALATAAGWTVQEGRWFFSTMEHCCQADANCIGNNPSTPYGTYALPPAPDQTVADPFSSATR